MLTTRLRWDIADNARLRCVVLRQHEERNMNLHQYKPMVVVDHRVEEGMNNSVGRWAVIKVEQTLASNGDVIATQRTLIGWKKSQVRAQQECDRRNGGRR
jgi:hypothetical protein